MRTETLRHHLAAAGLARVADDIVRLSRPCIRLDCHRAPDEAVLPAGCSKLGGTPDLPSGATWPSWRGSPMAFVAQVNLADIAAHDAEGDLPHAGVLSFFCSVDGSTAGLMQAPDDATSWTVSYVDGDPAALVRSPLPQDLHERLRFPACRASFRREPTLPDEGSREILGLGLSESERSAYIGVVMDSDADYRDAMGHHLLGYPLSLGESTLIAGHLAAHGIPHPYRLDLSGPPEEQQKKYLELQDKGPELLRDLQHKAEGEWRLLLQIYSNMEADMDWAGGGVLHFCIPKDALTRRDFTRVWANMQFM
jgi:uncharacterized protein DUF1963